MHDSQQNYFGGSQMSQDSLRRSAAQLSQASQSSSKLLPKSQFDIQLEQFSNISSQIGEFDMASSSKDLCMPAANRRRGNASSSQRDHIHYESRERSKDRKAKSRCHCDPNYFLSNRLCLICTSLALAENRDDTLAQDLHAAIPSTSPALAYGMLNARVLGNLLAARSVNGHVCLRVFADICLLAAKVQSSSVHSRLINVLMACLSDRIVKKEDFVIILQELLEKMDSAFCNSFLRDGLPAVQVIIDEMDFRCLLSLLTKADTRYITRDLANMLVEPLSHYLGDFDEGSAQVFSLLSAVTTNDTEEDDILKALISHGDLDIMENYCPFLVECPPVLLTKILSICPESVLRVLIDQHYLFETLAGECEKFASALEVLVKVLGSDDLSTIRLVFPALFSSLENSPACAACVETLVPFVPSKVLQPNSLLPPLRGARTMRNPGRVIISVTIAAEKIFGRFESADVVERTISIVNHLKAKFNLKMKTEI